MRESRGARIALEAGFLVAVAAVLGIAEVRPLWIVLVMALAWLIVALYEWASWREEPHWASGAPPRYHVPSRPLPPRPPSQELPSFTAYPRPPAARPIPATVNDAPTWIATPEMREELLGRRPEPEPEEIEARVQPQPEPEPEPEPEPAAEPEPRVEEPPEPAPERPAELIAVPSAEPAYELEEPAGWPIDDEDTASDPWTADDLDAGSEQAEVAEGPRRVRHRIDPFDGGSVRRWPWQQAVDTGVLEAELPPLPRHVRLDGEEGEG